MGFATPRDEPECGEHAPATRRSPLDRAQDRTRSHSDAIRHFCTARAGIEKLQMPAWPQSQWPEVQSHFATPMRDIQVQEVLPVHVPPVSGMS
ncbi:hypothetical protein BH11MYX1_BH11MYX1_16880 [soil metagenome]